MLQDECVRQQRHRKTHPSREQRLPRGCCNLRGTQRTMKFLTSTRITEPRGYSLQAGVPGGRPSVVALQTGAKRNSGSDRAGRQEWLSQRGAGETVHPAASSLTPRAAA